MRTLLSLIGIFLALPTSAAARSIIQQRDITGGAQFIFGRPANPNVSRGSGAKRPPRSPVKDQVDDAISLGNSARDRNPPDLDSAEKAYRLAWKLDPSDPRPYIGLGNIYMDRHNYAEAAKAYQQAIRFGAPSGAGISGTILGNPGPPNPVAQWHAYLGAASLANQNLRKAEYELIRAIALDPGRAEWHAGLGYSLFGQGRFTESVAAYKKATMLQPANDDYKRLLKEAQSRAERASVSDSALTKRLENTTWETDFKSSSANVRCKLLPATGVECENDREHSMLKWKIQDGLLQLIRPSTESRICIGPIGEKEISLKCFGNDVETEQVWRRP